jgi:uncharacterized membrane protein YbaN (DUF454 family)
MLVGTKRLLCIGGGLVSLGLAVAGAVLPLLPTTPFLLLAVFCFARSSPRLHGWLMSHQQFGPIIEAWRRERAIPASAKRAAYVAMGAVLALSWLLGVPVVVLVVQALVLAASALFIATRQTARPRSAEPRSS